MLLMILIILGFKLYQSQLLFTVLCVALEHPTGYCIVFPLARTVNFSLSDKARGIICAYDLHFCGCLCNLLC